MTKISNNIKIDFETNEIITFKDNFSTRTKVEPRIIHVLQILYENRPKVVLREQLIAEVWGNYGGADDALNQVVSHLRKLLNDNDKEHRIIETVVKKGYRFVGEIENVPSNKKVSKDKYVKVLLWIVMITTILLFIIKTMNIKETPMPDSDAPTNVSKDDNIVIPSPEIN